MDGYTHKCQIHISGQHIILALVRNEGLNTWPKQEGSGGVDRVEIG